MRIVSADEAVSGIESGQQIYIQCAAATPSVLLDALCGRAQELEDVKVVHLHCEGPHPHLAPEMEGHLFHRALFIGPNARSAINEGRAEFVPVQLSDVPLLMESGLLPLDAVFANMSPPDEHGFCSLGTSVESMQVAIRCAKTVIAQLNKSMPRTHGDSFVHVSQIDLAVEVDQPPYVYNPGEIGEVERRIGEYVADLIPDEATLQMGIGAIPTAVGMCLHDKKHLGVHTEMFTDPLVELVEKGVVDCSAKTIDPHKVVAAFMMGTPRLYKWVDGNPMLELRGVDYTNDTAVIRRNRRMTSVNSAIEVDLTGQVCADSLGHRLYSGVGGQMDFVRGASLAPDGRAIIALPSTTPDGKISRITWELYDGAGVTTTRSSVRTIVTEYGVAELFGQGLRERTRRLIAIAHPDFRDELTSYARKYHEL
jgi:4-hydroxybutyrate CoA-transferase